jgi:hypothetical protein
VGVFYCDSIKPGRLNSRLFKTTLDRTGAYRLTLFLPEPRLRK